MLLNDCLETGPQLQNLIWDILIRLRDAATGVVLWKKMFLKFHKLHRKTLVFGASPV